jgi:hypothetical protein
MGRPVKKVWLGNTSGTGQQIQCTAYVPGDSGSSTAYFTRQVGTGRFIANNGTYSGTVQLTNNDVSAAGYAKVTVTPYGGGTEYARKINDNTVITWQGNSYTWYPTGTSLTTPGTATLQTA